MTQRCLEDAPVQQWIPNLSVYLGHVSPVETYLYLIATPALLTTAVATFRQYASLEEKS
ncbi:hypothetical protein [Burkholderia singularis]|uniref:hypothetical protein n=1 Tax=Burkholderia singularis TaxID=1503053 RepID=UPI00159EE2ED|nr:hypothetical protein [Burkholderia singularis]